MSVSSSRGHACVSVTSPRVTNTVLPTLLPEMLQAFICVMRQLSRSAQSPSVFAQRQRADELYEHGPSLNKRHIETGDIDK